MAWGTESRARTSTSEHRKRRARVFARDGYACQLRYPNVCTGAAEEMDHIDNVANDGIEDDSNAQAVCIACHKVKTGKEAARARRIKAASLRIPREQHPGLI
ncbi:HNH endonuclease [Nocardia sp. NPDC058519]|uniref:HNH endonuclease n=1 Tax=Nocardia sp. NPDC058519 TaxID=3346535 RepID=UPI003664F3D4